LFYNDGKEIEKSKFLETKEELAAKFHGCTALTPAEGLWIDDDFSKYYDVNSGYLFRLSKFLHYKFDCGILPSHCIHHYILYGTL
jgi:hypothetical protein